MRVMKFIPFCYFKLLTEQEQGSVLIIKKKNKAIILFAYCFLKRTNIVKEYSTLLAFIHVVILIISFLGPAFGTQIFISCRPKFLRLPSILELFQKDIVLTLSHFTRLMTHMPFCIMAMAHSLCQGLL